MKNIISILAILFSCASASDSDLANALAEAGAACAAKGEIEKAKDSLYRALVYDLNCPIALFELAKIEEKSGDKKYATALYVRALPGLVHSRKDFADSKIRLLVPIHAKVSAAMDEYIRGLDRITQSKPDNAVLDAILKRVEVLHFETLVSLPKTPYLYQLMQGERDVVGIYRYKGPWWESEFRISADKTFIRVPVMIGGTWKVDGKTLRLKHSDGTLDILTQDKNGYSNARVFITRQVTH